MPIRPLVAGDFDAVHQLDNALTGSSRRSWLERRLRAALRDPAEHFQFAAEAEGLAGFLLARVAGGEFGRPEAAVFIEAIGVEPSHRGHHLGTDLIETLVATMTAREIHELATQASWREGSLLTFLDQRGFELSPRQVLERNTEPLRADEDEDAEHDAHEVRTLTANDLPAFVAIDRRLTGRDRSEYLRRKVTEALTESAVQVSLVAVDDGHPVGFVMARVDSGDFGRMLPVAVLDTVAVDPRFAGRGHGAALFDQLVKNLGALGVERVQTEVDRTTYPLLAWFDRLGFRPSERLVLRRLV